MVLRGSRLRSIVPELSDRINEILQVINEHYAYSPGDDTLGRVVKELRNKATNVSLIKGNGQITSKSGDLEVVYVTLASSRRNALNDAVNYYTDVLMIIKQTVELMEKLGVTDDYVLIIDGSSIDLVIGYSLPDMSDTPVIKVPSVKDSVEVESVLGGVSGLSKEEYASVIGTINEFLSKIENMTHTVETTIKLDSIEYPEPFRKIESKLGDSQ